MIPAWKSLMNRCFHRDHQFNWRYLTENELSSSSFCYHLSVPLLREAINFYKFKPMMQTTDCRPFWLRCIYKDIWNSIHVQSPRPIQYKLLLILLREWSRGCSIYICLIQPGVSLVSNIWPFSAVHLQILDGCSI